MRTFELRSMNHREFLQSLPVSTRTELTKRSDRAGLGHLAVHVGLILGVGLLIGMQVPLWYLLLLPQGILIVFLFTLQHEATHQTPFATTGINEWVGRICAIAIVQPFLDFRHFHLVHHRHTNDPEKDPELRGGAKPETIVSLLAHLSTAGYWHYKVRLLFRHAGGRTDEAYLPVSRHQAVRNEARLMLLVYTAALLFSLTVSAVLLWAWLLPLILGFPVLRLYLLAEHGLCPTVPNMFDNTRTTYTNRLVRFIAWNMPYHTEHHVLPSVPFHRLPELNRHIRDYLLHTESGYAAFAERYLRSLKY